MTAGPHDLSPGRDHVGVGALVFDGEGRVLLAAPPRPLSQVSELNYAAYAEKYGLGKFR